jgi:hypothetical protein
MIGGGTVVTEPIASHSTIHLQAREAAPDDGFAQIRESLRGLKFGSVNIIVQDGVIIQIDRTEKRRLRSTRNHNS